MLLFETLNHYPLLVTALGITLGLLVGSFLNVVIYRLPVMMERDWKAQCSELLGCESTTDATDNGPFNLAVPQSRCPNCAHLIRAWENIPVLSYLWLKGRCAECKHPIAARYPLLELASGLLSGLIVYQYGLTFTSLALLCVTWALIALTMIDFDHQLLPDSITLPLLWAGLIVNSQGLIVDLDSALWGAVCGYLSLWLVYWGFKLITGKEGMGYGDFKLLGALGAWAGWQMLPMILLLSSLVGAIIGIVLMAMRKQGRGQPMPFGPYLAIAGWIALLWGEQITRAYWHWSGLN